MSNLLSDDTWRQLDPRVGRLSPRDRRRVRLALVAGALLIAAAAAVAASGLVIPRIADPLLGGGSYAYGYHGDDWVVYHTFEVRNAGAVPFEITGVGRSGRGLELIDFPVEIGGHPAGEVNELGRLGPGERMELGVAYQVTDCAAVPDEPWPVPVNIGRPWGTYTAWIGLPSQSFADFDLLAEDGDDAVWYASDVEWQRSMADTVCYHRDGVVPPQR
jgi:hypothetical protein